MSAHDRSGRCNLEARTFVSSSNGERNTPMDYEIIETNSELADKDKHQLNVVEDPGVLSRFELADDLEAQLGFDESWGSHFSREESAVLGLESGSQNLDFHSTTSKTSTVNVWSEATSTESVQMLLNSVGHEIQNFNEDAEKLDLEPKKPVEFNGPKQARSTMADPLVACKETVSTNQQGCQLSTIEVKVEEQGHPVGVEHLEDLTMNKPVPENESSHACTRYVEAKTEVSNKVVVDTEFSSQADVPSKVSDNGQKGQSETGMVSETPGGEKGPSETGTLSESHGGEKVQYETGMLSESHGGQKGHFETGIVFESHGGQKGHFETGIVVESHGGQKCQSETGMASERHGGQKGQSETDMASAIESHSGQRENMSAKTDMEIESSFQTGSSNDATASDKTLQESKLDKCIGLVGELAIQNESHAASVEATDIPMSIETDGDTDSGRKQLDFNCEKKLSPSNPLHLSITMEAAGSAADPDLGKHPTTADVTGDNDRADDLAQDTSSNIQNEILTQRQREDVGKGFSEHSLSEDQKRETKVPSVIGMESSLVVVCPDVQDTVVCETLKQEASPRPIENIVQTSQIKVDREIIQNSTDNSSYEEYRDMEIHYSTNLAQEQKVSCPIHVETTKDASETLPLDVPYKDVKRVLEEQGENKTDATVKGDVIEASQDSFPPLSRGELLKEDGKSTIEIDQSEDGIKGLENLPSEVPHKDVITVVEEQANDSKDIAVTQDVVEPLSESPLLSPNEELSKDEERTGAVKMSEHKAQYSFVTQSAQDAENVVLQEKKTECLIVSEENIEVEVSSCAQGVYNSENLEGQTNNNISAFNEPGNLRSMQPGASSASQSSDMEVVPKLVTLSETEETHGKALINKESGTDIIELVKFPDTVVSGSAMTSLDALPVDSVTVSTEIKAAEVAEPATQKESCNHEEHCKQGLDGRVNDKSVVCDEKLCETPLGGDSERRQNDAANGNGDGNRAKNAEHFVDEHVTDHSFHLHDAHSKHDLKQDVQVTTGIVVKEFEMHLEGENNNRGEELSSNSCKEPQTVGSFSNSSSEQCKGSGNMLKQTMEDAPNRHLDYPDEKHGVTSHDDNQFSMMESHPNEDTYEKGQKLLNNNEVHPTSKFKDQAEEHAMKKIREHDSQKHVTESEVIEAGKEGCKRGSADLESKIVESEKIFENKPVEEEEKGLHDMEVDVPGDDKECEKQLADGTMQKKDLQEATTVSITVGKINTETLDSNGNCSRQGVDTFTFDTRTTKDISFSGDVNTSPEFPIADHDGIFAGRWKPFDAREPRDAHKEMSTVRSAEVKAGNFNNHSQDTSKDNEINCDKVMTVESTSQSIQGKSSTMSITENLSCSVKQIDSISLTSEDKGDREATRLCSSTISSELHRLPENQSSRSMTREEEKVANSSSAQPAGALAVTPSSLPDLNTTAAPTSVSFLQPFTDAQQVQLRAQILVYGSLIQGSLPDEDLMLTAFADIRASQSSASASDGNRGLWENTWRLAADRIQRKMFSNSSDILSCPSCTSTTAAVSGTVAENLKSTTPGMSANIGDGRAAIPGTKPTDLVASRASSSSTRMAVIPHPGKISHKSSLPSIVTTPHSLTMPSPVWGMSTPVNDAGIQSSAVARNLHFDAHQIAAARHLYQSPQFAHYTTGVSSSRLSTLPLPAPWITSSQGTFVDSGLQMANFTQTDVAQELPSNRRMSGSTSSSPYTPKIPLPSNLGSIGTVSAIHSANKGNSDVSKSTTVSTTRQVSSDKKSVKRKRKSVSGDLVTSPANASSSEQAQLLNGVSKHAPELPNSVGPSIFLTASPSPLSSSLMGSAILPTGPHYQVISKGDTGQRVGFSEETATRIEQARQDAEEAAVSATSAVRHSQGVWNQLASQKSSGLVSECEAKLASAAVAAAAAALVAKAGAAAAKLASDAALQAKLLANEALNPDGKSSLMPSFERETHQDSPGHSNSIIAAAREAAKKRIESVAAAAKRAENLDAVVRAAELASQAVSQAGVVVAMGDPVPLTLNALLEAGPEAYYKLMNQDTIVPTRDGTNNGASVVSNKEAVQDEANNASEKFHKSSKLKDRRHILKNGASWKDSAREALKHGRDNGELLKQAKDSVQALNVTPDIVSVVRDSEAPRENQISNRGQLGTASDMQPNSMEEVAASNVDSDDKRCKEALPLHPSGIKELSLVEVVSDEEGLRGVWFAAKVLDIKDGKAHVRYDELLADDGVSQLQEWIPLEGENGKAPRIRMAHPMTVMKFEGTRKRRREAMGTHAWTVGDRVDAWMRDGWWEGIIAEKGDNDESKFTVHFPGEGDTAVIKSWNLRPSLIWKDGQWIEWTNLKSQKEASHEVELPFQKRHKMSSLEATAEVKGKERPHRVPNTEDAKKVQELNALMSSCKSKFSVPPKCSSDDRGSGSVKVNNMALLKEGFKFVPGVPKPTKKRKFMDVSKQYADSMARKPPAKYPQRGDRQKALLGVSNHNAQKPVGKAEDKTAKRPVISKLKEPKIGKAREDQPKTKVDKGSFSHGMLAKGSSGHDVGFPTMPASIIDGARAGRNGGAEVSVSGNQNSDATLPSVMKESISYRRSPSRTVKTALDSEQDSKAKQPFASDSANPNAETNMNHLELTAGKVGDRAAPEKVEPRRSSRRIQPTSRLLEGLQTSSSVIKSSTYFTHEKGGKGHSKTSKGNSSH
eukprot:TRINITY_DN877_c0_g1_i1.p1 TRINITY_DN877_c0_g1~~TRINITY_DN877_c0_g1_i1.p1  ORF type:complete len:2679 (+),score=711.17 TRINITY_DN877_c0_g1_i1:274-8310(+)